MCWESFVTGPYLALSAQQQVSSGTIDGRHRIDMNDMQCLMMRCLSHAKDLECYSGVC